MLTIKGYDKLDGRYVTPTYRIRQIKETKNFYDFYMVNQQTGFSAVIGLKRTSKMLAGANLYDIIWNGQKTSVSVTSDWIADKNNMINALSSVTEQNPW